MFRHYTAATWAYLQSAREGGSCTFCHASMLNCCLFSFGVTKVTNVNPLINEITRQDSEDASVQWVSGDDEAILRHFECNQNSSPCVVGADKNREREAVLLALLILA